MSVSPSKESVASLPKILNFIGGEFCQPESKEFLPNYEPATGKVYSYLPDSDSRDLDKAVEAARKTFPMWSQMSHEVRGEFLLKMADRIAAKIRFFAEAESRDQGKPVWLAESVDIPRVIANLRFFANSLKYQGNETYAMPSQNGQATFNYTIRKPVGVAGLISPWNLPLYVLTWKLAPALAFGNTVVCKPSEITSMTAFLLCEVAKEIGLPPGVLNIVFGDGPKAGEPLVQHPQVPLISFTGGTQTGKRLYASSASRIKKLSLELGGKNANIIFGDCDFEQALQTTVRSSFLNQGEICLCGSRIFVEETIYEKFLAAFIKETKSLKVGDPRNKDSFLGPLVSKAHLEKVQSYLRLAESEGGKIETGREALELSEEFQGGYFMRPTILTHLSSAGRVMTEEIFGPVVTVTPFAPSPEGERAVVAMANSVEYGLSASLWTKDVSRVHRMGQVLEVGTLWVNTWMKRDLRVPFGGVKMSGLGREGGHHSLDFFTEQTNICVQFQENI